MKSKSMMNTLRGMCAALCVVCGALGASADTATIGDVTWTYSVSGGTATITAQSGAAGEVTVPGELGGAAVKIIGNGVFKGNSAITSISMPTVEQLGNQAVMNCANLTTVSMPAIVTIGEDCFCDSRKLSGDLDLSNLQTIGAWGFQRVFKITSINMPNVTSIGKIAFQDCQDLKTVTMSSVTTIGANAFEKCYALEYIKLPPSLTTVGTKAFNTCTDLKEISIDKSSALDEAALKVGNSAKVTRYGTATVGGVTWNYTFIDGVATINSQLGATGAVTIPEDFDGVPVQELAMSLFNNNDSITSVAMPFVKKIGNKAFFGCDNLISVTMSAVEQIGDDCFCDCKNLDGDFVLPNLTKVGQWAFQRAFRISSVAMPNVKSVGNYAFEDAKAMTNVVMTAVESIGEYAFRRSSKLAYVDMQHARTLAKGAFVNCSELKSVIMNDAEQIGVDCFCDCPKLEGDFDLPKLKKVDNYAFQRARLITSIKMPCALTVGNYAFEDALALTNVVMTSVQTIGNYAFNRGSNLRSVKLPYCATGIGDNVFCSRTNLETIYIHAASTLEEARLKMNASDPPLNAAVVRYGGAWEVNGVNWYYDDLEDGTASVVAVGELVGEVNVPSRLNGKSVTHIEIRAFADQVGVTSVTIPHSVKSVGSAAFTNCSELTSIHVLATSTDLIDALRQEYGESLVETYHPDGTTVVLR